MALGFSFAAQRNGSSLLSIFSNQLLNQHKLLLFFFHLDSVLILYTIIRHHDENNKFLKKNKLVKNSACQKTATPSCNPNSRNKTAVENHKRRTNDKKKFFLFLLLTTVERDRYKVAPILLIIPYIVTIFLYKKDTTHRNVFIFYFLFFISSNY